MSAPVFIFDRSAFHGHNFDLLAASSLLEKVCRNHITVHHSPIFLEETLAMYETPKNHPIAIKQLPFILSICNGAWMKDRQELWRMELVQNKGPKTNPFIPPLERARGEDRMRDMIKTGNIKHWEVAALREDMNDKKTAQKKTLVSIREEIAAVFRNDSRIKRQKMPTFREFVASEGDGFARELILRKMLIKKADSVFRQWRSKKSRYPYFTSFVEGMLYSGYHAMLEHDESIDRNAQADVEHLTYLNHADIVISNDMGFQFSAFRELWRPKGKQFFSVEQFLEFIGHKKLS